MSNLSQSVESMLSVHSGSANRRAATDLPTNSDNDVQQTMSGDDVNGCGRSHPTPALETMQETPTESEDQTEVVDGATVAMTTDMAGIAEDVKSGEDGDATCTESERTDAECVDENGDDERKKEKLLYDVIGDLGAKVVDGERVVERTVEVEMSEGGGGGGAEEELRSELTHVRSNDTEDGEMRSDRSCIVDTSSSCLGLRGGCEGGGGGGGGESQWRSKDLELGLSSYVNGRKRLDPGRLENRRCTSEISLDLLSPVESDAAAKSSHSRRIIEMSSADKALSDGASVRSNGSDDKNGINRYLNHCMIIRFLIIV